MQVASSMRINRFPFTIVVKTHFISWATVGWRIQAIVKYSEVPGIFLKYRCTIAGYHLAFLVTPPQVL